MRWILGNLYPQAHSVWPLSHLSRLGIFWPSVLDPSLFSWWDSPFEMGLSLPFMFFYSKLKENDMNSPNWCSHFSLSFVFFSAKWKSNGYTPPPVEQVSTLQCSRRPHRVGWTKEVFPFARLPKGKGFAALSWCLCAVTVWNPFPWEPCYHI